MAYEYYRSNYPGWGTSDFRIGTPPAPAFWPQPAWRGWDYYQAYGINPDHGLFSSILRNNRTSSRDADGFNSSDVRALHRQVYSGMVNLAMVPPGDIGAAAAYEAYRTWKQHTNLYQPLGGDSNREKEGLVGLAVAEASRLWSCGGRPMDNFAIRNAFEGAAATASMLFYRRLGRDAGMPPMRRSSEVYERDFAYGSMPGSARSAPMPMPRTRTASFGGGLPGSIGSSPSMYGGGSYGSYGGQPGSSPYGGVGANLSLQQQPYPNNGFPGSYAGSQPGGYAGVVPGQYPYSGQMGQPGVQYLQQQPGQVMFPSQGSMMMQGGVPLQSSPSMYGGGGVLSGQGGIYPGGGVVIPGGGIPLTAGNVSAYNAGGGSLDGYPPGTIIIRQPHRSHRRSSSSSRHRHRKHSHHRSRSMEPPLLIEGPGGGYDDGGSWYH